MPSIIELHIREASGYPYPRSRRIWPAEPWMGAANVRRWGMG